MKLKAEIGAWSSVVGGGVLLIAGDGRMAGQIAFLCHDDALRDKATQEQLARLCCGAINGTRAPISPAVLAELPEVRALVADALDAAADKIDARGGLEQQDFGLNRATQNFYRARNLVREFAAAIREGRG